MYVKARGCLRGDDDDDDYDDDYDDDEPYDAALSDCNGNTNVR